VNDPLIFLRVVIAVKSGTACDRSSSAPVRAAPEEHLGDESLAGSTGNDAFVEQLHLRERTPPDLFRRNVAGAKFIL